MSAFENWSAPTRRDFLKSSGMLVVGLSAASVASQNHCKAPASRRSVSPSASSRLQASAARRLSCSSSRRRSQSGRSGVDRLRSAVSAKVR